MNEPPDTIRNTPKARVRSWPRNVRCTMAESCGAMMPAPTPWIRRNANRTPMVGASALPMMLRMKMA